MEDVNLAVRGREGWTDAAWPVNRRAKPGPGEA